ncbi:hypothetical protein OAK47_03095 [Planctomycetaceae bacterium]|jgi:hypothetical protein|nr:hypothetical protein [bacterium]MDB4786595.1 hypothetical protein [Planctomycetaceae bacterium]MDC0262189.1 hypothetical protein [Planctomycetaceae bacterium]MDC0308286.1 hypothetical protein [Planctomycetaceae bacterium]MDG2389434.1 hypothetical protein [Planctomycetaceae bacterium]
MNDSSLKKIAFLVLLPVLVIGLCLTGAGCGGGVDAVTTVTLKPAELESDGAKESGSGGDKPTKSGGAAGSGPGNLVGRFILDGAAPNLSPLIAKGASVKDAEYCSAEAVPNQSLVVGEGGGIANMFIYLDKAPKGFTPEGILAELVFDQKNCTFVPHGLVVQVGQTVLVKNADGAAHNTNMKVVRNKSFNQVVNGNDRNGVPLIYEKPEPAPIKAACDFHAWMGAYQLVIDHPFAACSKADGTFEIKNLPAGEYKFRVWHESAGLLERSLKVKIEAGKDNKLEQSYSVGSFTKL